MNQTMPPQSTQILVVGGGPAGSTAATLLSREGFDVTLLEREVFPRYHIGESLLPSALEIFDLLGVREKIEAHGFQRKPGAYLEWGSEKWSLNFGELTGSQTYSFQVRRAEFDQLLLDHAKAQGVKVHEGCEVRHLYFQEDRPYRATWAKGNNDSGEISFDYLLDASGRAGLLSTRYLQNRYHHDVFQNVAIWGYWKGVKRLPKGQEGAIAVGSIQDGWLWAIPLDEKTMSIGAVIHKSTYKARRTQSLRALYDELMTECSLVADMVAPGELVSKVSVEEDYSYSADRFSGPGYFILGDAACFLDPLLSSGVHLATYSALLAAASTTSLLNAEVDEAQAANFYDQSYRQAYLRFLVFVSAFYDQNRGKDSYFWEAQKLSRHDFKESDLKLAFLNLVSGIEDLVDAQESLPEVVGEMSKQIKVNHSLRQDKQALETARTDDSARQNVQFFNSVEGFASLSAAGAINGLYVVTQPSLGLAKVSLGAKPALVG